MSLGALVDGSVVPDAQQVDALLGEAAAHWRAIVDAISDAHPPVTSVWNFGGAKYGWSLRLKRRDRVVAYLIPQTGGFLAGIVLGERAYQAAQSLDLPQHIRQLLEAAPRYGEGHGFRVPVTYDDDVTAVVQLVAAKMADGR